ncbi:MAG: hypothetical protein V1681_07000 [Candidatus Neomarinimicrobiota bacterium]
MILLKIFLILLGVLILLLLGVLIPKIWLKLKIHLTEPAKTGTIHIQLAGKLISALVTIDWPDINVKAGIGGLYFPVWNKKSAVASPKKPTAKPKPAKKSKRKPVRRSSAQWLGFGREIVSRFFQLPRIEKFSADLVVGLDNPASTGLMMGAYYATTKTLDVFRSVRIAPDFINKKFIGEIEFWGSIRLIKTIPLVIFTLRFLWNKK